MKPILFDKTATVFTNLGKGMLTEVTAAVVTEEVNGIFDLEIDIAKSDPLFNEIENGSIILAIPSPYRSPEPFRVYKVEKELAGISTIYAHHLSYDLAGIVVNPYTASTAAAALTGLGTNAAQACPFSFSTTKTVTAAFSLAIPQAIRTTLGGVEGSILDTYRGEYIFSGYSVQLVNRRGTDRGVEVRYRKNMVGLSVQEDDSGVVDGVVPYWTSEGATPVYGSIQWKTGLSSGRVITVDYSEKYQDPPTAAVLNAAAAALVNTSGYGESKLSIDVDFIHLGTEKGSDWVALEQCDLGDTIKVIAEPLGTTRSAEVVAIETDVLLEKYNKVTIGSVRADVAQKIVANEREAVDVNKTTKSFLEASIAAATSRITGATDGYIRFGYNQNDELSEIYAMDTNDPSTAQKVLRLNYAGWGLSTTGINGPYSYALTAVDGLNASLIKVGILQGIRAILESGSIGGWDIESSWIKKDYQGLDGDGNSRTIRAALVAPSSDSMWVLYSMYTINGTMYPKFVIKADGSARFKMLEGLVVGDDVGVYDTILHGNLFVGTDAYNRDTAMKGNLFVSKAATIGGDTTIGGAATISGGARVGGTARLFGGWTYLKDYLMLGTLANDTFTTNARLYSTSPTSLIFYMESYYQRSLQLGQVNGHWGLAPLYDTYLDLGLSGNRWDNIYAQNGTIQTSDKNAKKGIRALTKKALEFVRKLKPKSFQMKKGTSGRRHWGFIAQDVEEAMGETGIKLEDFAGLVKDEEGRYGLRYEELIAPLVMLVQDLDKRVEALEGAENGNC